MDDERKKSENLPPGFRFHPTDEELITYYLKNKIADSNFTGRAIADVDLNRCEPWDLPGIYISIFCYLQFLWVLFIYMYNSCRQGEDGGEGVVLL